jgi:hypothetical protein
MEVLKISRIVAILLLIMQIVGVGVGTGYFGHMTTCQTNSLYLVPHQLFSWFDSYQKPRTGDAYGFCQVYNENLVNAYQGYAQTKLKHTLVNGKTYCITYYLSGFNNDQYTIDKMGAYLSATPFICATTASISVSKTMIEDAITALDLKNVTAPIVAGTNILSIADVTFNKNYTAINIDSYTANVNYPQSITNTVFTCRKLITNDHSTYLGMGAVTYNWATAPINVALKNTTFNTTGIINNTGVTTNDVFSVASFPTTNLGIPNAGTISRQGIALTNVGVNTGTTPPTFYNFYLNGGTAFSSLNLFDNMSYGINALNSNVKSSNAAYQNMSQYGTTSSDPMFPFTFYAGGAGINSENNTSANVYNIDVSPTVASYNQGSNLFFHNVYGIKTNNVQYANIQYAMIHSNRVYSNALVTAGALYNGEQGIYMQNPDYTTITANNNFITNVNTGITFLASSSAYPAGSHLKNLGQVTISTNTLQADYATIPATGKALLTAVVADNLFNCSECIADDHATDVRVVTNAIKSAFRGIKSSNWQHQFCYAANNNITLAQEPNGFKGALTTQYGILHQNNIRDIVNSNIITGFGVAKTTVYAIKASDNFGQAMLCNNTSNTFEGFSFSGAQNLVTWQKNYMQSHVRGLHVNNTIIGQQGSATGAMDNVWQTGGLGWAGTNYQTYITTSSAATSALNSKLYVKNNSLSYPTNNGATGVLPTPYQSPTSILITSANSPYTCPSAPGGGGGSGGAAIGTSALASSATLGTAPTASTTAVTLATAANQVVTNNVPYSQYTVSKQANGKQSVYNYTVKNASIATGNTTLQNFMALAASSNLASIVAVEKQLVNGNLAMASTVNTNITANNSPESNAQLLYSLALKTKTNNYQLSDDAALLTLSNGCPDRDGLAVYQARVLYNSIHQHYTHFEDNCTMPSGARMGNSEDHQSTSAPSYDNLISIYPNPNTGNATINLIDAGIMTMQLKVYDVNGRLVFEDRVEDMAGKNYELNVELKSGMYFVEVVDITTDAHYKQKLVIQQ